MVYKLALVLELHSNTILPSLRHKLQVKHCLKSIFRFLSFLTRLVVLVFNQG